MDHEDEYVDEDRHTTVTVEEVNVTRRGLQKVGVTESEDEGSEPGDQVTKSKDTGKQKRVWTKERPKVPKKKKKKFRYESKADRKSNRAKERAGREKAKARREAE